jgi:ATP-dependent DNA ligase
MARSKFSDCCCVRFGSFSANRHIKNADGIPGTIHLWAFDLLAFNGRDLRLQPLVKRQARQQVLLERFG